MADAARQSLVPIRAASLTRFGRELVAMLILFAIYKFGRVVHTSDVSLAYENAQRIWDLERWARLPNELDAQKAILPMQGLVEFANTYYAFVHIPGTAAFLIWLYLRRPELYPPVRRAIIAMTAIALVGHMIFPLAPPRMLSDYGFVDTAALYGPNVYHGDPDAQSMINQYAAMPSLHVGWDLLIGIALVAHAGFLVLRAIGVVLPLFMTVAVVATANHYVIDAVVGIAIVLLCLALAVRIERSRIPFDHQRVGPPPRGAP